MSSFVIDRQAAHQQNDQGYHRSRQGQQNRRRFRSEYVASLFRPPSLIGSFEMKWDSYGKIYTEPPSCLRVLNLPSHQQFVNYNLLDGYTSMVSGGGAAGYGNKVQDRTGIMKWMAAHYRLIKSNSPDKLFAFDFITGRGTLQCLMSQICSRNRGKEYIAATLYKGNIYLKVLPIDENLDETSNKNSYAGLCFEEFVTKPALGTTDQPRDPRLNYSDANKYYHVLMSKFGEHKVLYSAEADCVDVDPQGREPQLESFVELKTSMPIRVQVDGQGGRRGEITKHFMEVKSLDWWSQCVISGVSSMLVGYKNGYKDLRVRELELIKVRDLPEIGSGWNPVKCFEFVHHFLNCVKNSVTEDNPDMIYLFMLDGESIYKPIKQSPKDSPHYPIVTAEIIHMFNKSINRFVRTSDWISGQQNHQQAQISSRIGRVINLY